MIGNIQRPIGDSDILAILAVNDQNGLMTIEDQKQGALANRSDANPATLNAESLSQLLARILNQLSTSAWLPSSILVFLVLLIATTWVANGDVIQGFTKMVQVDLPQLALIVGAVIMMTTLTQAFEFGAIQTLEGYWGRGRLGQALAARGVRRFAAKKSELQNRLCDVRERLVGQMRARLAEADDVSESDLAIIENDILERPEIGSDQERDSARSINWQACVDSSLVRLSRELENALEFYPQQEFDILPTRFGNTMRSYEERGPRDDENRLQGYVERLIDRLPVELRNDHDLHRQRLDLYASLVFVFAAAGLLSAPILAFRSNRWGLILSIACLAFASLSYRATIAAAKGYGGMLEVIRFWDGNSTLLRQASTTGESVSSNDSSVEGIAERHEL